MPDVSSSKAEKYIAYNLEDLGFIHEGTINLYSENMESILMSNYNYPTEMNRIIDIQTFTLKAWFDQGNFYLNK